MFLGSSSESDGTWYKQGEQGNLVLVIRLLCRIKEASNQWETVRRWLNHLNIGMVRNLLGRVGETNSNCGL